MQLKLDDLLAGSTATELAAADQALAAAQAGATKAQNDYDDLVDGATVADKTAAAQAVSAAAAQLATAKANREKLKDAPTAADRAAAEAGVAAAQSGLTAAQNSANSAQNAVTSAAASLKSAEATYCTPRPRPSAARSRTLVLHHHAVRADLGRRRHEGERRARGYARHVRRRRHRRQHRLPNAVNAANSATAAVTSAQRALDLAQAKLAAANDGPSSADVSAAAAAVTSAQAAQTAATEKLNTVNEGATDFQLSTARAAMDSAFAALAAAQCQARRGLPRPEGEHDRPGARRCPQRGARRRGGADPSQECARSSPRLMARSVPSALSPGEFFGASTTNPAIVLLTPDRLTLKMDVGETDYANLKTGQAGGVLFDSIPGRVYPFVILGNWAQPLGDAGRRDVPVKASLVLPADAPRPAPGMNARGQIITESKPNLLVVPPRAIRKSGNDQVVDVRRDGSIVAQVVTTGATDTGQVEVVTGLVEGDVVVVASLTSARPGATPKPQPTLPGNVR